MREQKIKSNILPPFLYDLSRKLVKNYLHDIFYTIASYLPVNSIYFDTKYCNLSIYIDLSSHFVNNNNNPPTIKQILLTQSVSIRVFVFKSSLSLYTLLNLNMCCKHIEIKYISCIL